MCVDLYAREPGTSRLDVPASRLCLDLTHAPPTLHCDTMLAAVNNATSVADLVNDAVAAGKRSPLGSVLDTSKDSFGGVEHDNDGLVSLLGSCFVCCLVPISVSFLCFAKLFAFWGRVNKRVHANTASHPPRRHRC